MVRHGGSSAGSYLTDPTSPIPSHCASVAMASTLRVNRDSDCTSNCSLYFYQETLHIDGRTWAMAEIPSPSAGSMECGLPGRPQPPLVVTQHLEADRRFVILNSQVRVIHCSFVGSYLHYQVSIIRWSFVLGSYFHYQLWGPCYCSHQLEKAPCCIFTLFGTCTL